MEWGVMRHKFTVELDDEVGVFGPGDNTFFWAFCISFISNSLPDIGRDSV